MNSKASEVDLPPAVGRPRYFSARASFVNVQRQVGKLDAQFFFFIALVEFARPCARWLLEENLYGDNERLLDVRTPVWAPQNENMQMLSIHHKLTTLSEKCYLKAVNS